MTAPSAADLRAAAAAAQELLASVPDFSAPVPAMDGDVGHLVVHIATCLQWYAHDLLAPAAEAPGADAVVAGRRLAGRPGPRARHQRRTARPGRRPRRPRRPRVAPVGRGGHRGMAAIGIAEIVLHTDDVAAAAGLPWTPPAGPVAAVRSRLFPDAPPDGDAWAVLRWASGRGDLPGRERVADWQYAMEPP